MRALDAFAKAPKAKTPEQIVAENARATEVAAALEAEEPLFDAKRHDGLWLLRFLLSARLKVPKAVQAAKSAPAPPSEMLTKAT